MTRVSDPGTHWEVTDPARLATMIRLRALRMSHCRNRGQEQAKGGEHAESRETHEIIPSRVSRVCRRDDTATWLVQTATRKTASVL